MIEFFTRDPRAPDSDLLETMAAAGSQIGQFVERKRDEEDVRRSAALKTAMLEAALDCVVAIDHEGRVIEFNPAAEKTFGYKREDAIGREMASLIIPPHLRDRHRRGLARYIASGEATVLDRRIELPGMRADGTEFPAELAVTRIGDVEPPLFTAYIRDITDRKESEAELEFLARATAVLDESLDLKTTLNTLARLAVPYLGDGCMVDLLDDGSIRRVASAAAEPSMEPVLEELRRHSIDPAGPHPIATAMRTGEVQIVPDISEQFRREIADTEPYYEALQHWPARSAVVAPLRARGKILGTIALASFSPERTYSSREASLIAEVARRAANAVENARLFEERSRLARTLQQSILPGRLPEVPGAELAARFQPASGGSEVGGDFYDVFPTSDGGWAIVIGDVPGRGVEAATATAVARHTIRAAAIRESSPASMLAMLNEAFYLQLDGSRFCTAVLGLLRVAQGSAKLCVASAGHPLPLLLSPDGSVEPIGRAGALLGVLPEPRLAEDEIELSGGQTVVFYTNGVSEARDAQGDFGLAELIALVGSCVDLDAAATAECIDRAVVDADARNVHDDAAILVLRILESSPELAGSRGGAKRR